MTLGAIAELKVKNPRLLDDPLMHRIPSKIMAERMKVELGIGPFWVLTKQETSAILAEIKEIK